MRAGDQAASVFLSLNGWCMVAVYLSFSAGMPANHNPGSGRANCALPSLLIFEVAGLGVLLTDAEYLKA